MVAYRDKDGNVRPELLDKEAESIAKSFAEGNDRLSTNQLRRFYGDFKQLEKKYKTKTGSGKEKEKVFKEILPLVKMQRSKAEYALNRRTITEGFKNFLVENIQFIDNWQKFEDFMLYFEAVVGFCYGKGVLKGK
jgi:CRISPR-associated protein Csm2